MREHYRKKGWHVVVSLLLFFVTVQTQAGIGFEAERTDFVVTIRDGHGVQTGSCHKLHAKDVVTCTLTLTAYQGAKFVTISNTGNSVLKGLTFTAPNTTVATQDAATTTCTQNQNLVAGAACNLGYSPVAPGGGTTSVTVNSQNAGSLTIQINVI